MIKVWVLSENMAGGRGLLGEHGLSLLLQVGEKRLLFDTGQSDVFLKNAYRLEEDLLKLDGIILSHGHFDHCGGMEALIKSYRDSEIKLPPIYVRDGAFHAKLAVNPGRITYRNIGIPWRRQLVQEAVHISGDREEIGAGIWLLGNIPYTVNMEGRPDTFFIDTGEGKVPDYMEDEQLLVIETEKGLCIFGGCCHPGILNCLAHVRNSFPDRPIFSVFAGMHLMNQGKERILKTADALLKTDIKILMPVHCTGLEAIGKIKDVLGDRCRLMETGKVFEL